MRAYPAFHLALTLLLASFASTAAGPPSTLKRSDLSPSGDFRIEHRHDADFQFTIWLVSVRNPKLQRVLFKPDYGNARDPDLLISPDEQCIARTQTRGSTCITVILHRRKGPLEYREAGDLEKPVWRFLTKSFALAEDEIRPFHRDLIAVRWLDAKTLLLRVTGDSPVGREFSLRDWYCVYHTDRKAFSVLPEHQETNSKALWLAKRGESR